MSTSPFPTKEQVLEFVRDADGPVGKREIARAFRLDAEQKRELKKLLRELKDDGTLAQGRRKRLSDPATLPSVAVIEVTGIDMDGDVLARPIKWDHEIDPPTIFIVPDRAAGPAPGRGERALARLSKSGDSYDARIIRRISSPTPDVLGIVILSENERRIRPVEKRLRHEYVIEPGDVEAAVGDLVRAVPSRSSRLGLKRARIVERIAEADGPRAVSLISVNQHGIPVEFPADAIKQAKRAKAAPLGKREDLRDLPLVTIDGADARDFDDAVYAEADDAADNPDGFKLIVAIADVGWYVRASDALDKAAFDRGNSVYFPDRVVPMLPEELSNGWCSLVPDEDRPCVVAHMRINAHGELISKRFSRALMRSAARLTYEQVQRAVDGDIGELSAAFVDATIAPLYAAFELLDAARAKRGALNLDVAERRVVLNEAGEMTGVALRDRLDSHKLIEEFMVLANVAAAEYLEEKKRPCMYRVHDEPSLAKLEALSEFLRSLKMPYDRGQSPSPQRFNQILGQVKDTAHERMVNDVVLRTQAQATYDPNNIGHFGLGLRRYCHFTSPIRRYSDLLVHRALLRGMKPSDGALSEEPIDLEKIGEHLSMTERRAQAAERDAMDRYAAHFLSERVGAEFIGRVSGVSRFGLFIAIDSVGADGLVPIRSLPDDYYVHDEATHTLTGERNGLTYRLGDAVDVVLREATPVTGGLLFEIAGTTRSRPSTQTRRKPAHTGSSAKKNAKTKGKSRAARRRARQKSSRSSEKRQS